MVISRTINDAAAISEANASNVSHQTDVRYKLPPFKIKKNTKSVLQEMISEVAVIEIITEITHRVVSIVDPQDRGFHSDRVRVVGVEMIVEMVGDHHRHPQEIGVTIIEQMTVIAAKQPVHIIEIVIIAAMVAVVVVVVVVVDHSRVVALAVGSRVPVMGNRGRGNRKVGIRDRQVGIKRKGRGAVRKIRISGNMGVVVAEEEEVVEDRPVMDRIMVIRTITMGSIRRIGADHNR